MRRFSPLSDRLESDAWNIAGVLAALPKDKQAEIESVLTEYASQLPERDIRRVYAETVSYTHLDVYKRQPERRSPKMRWHGLKSPCRRQL